MCVCVCNFTCFIFGTNEFGYIFIPPTAVDNSDQDFIFTWERNTRTHVWK